MDFLLRNPCIPVVEISQVAHAVPLAKAILEGGITAIEITLRTAQAFDCIASIAAAQLPIALGVGSLTTPAQVQRAKQLGAQFGVSPALTEGLAAAALQHQLDLIPGVATPSEALRAYELGFAVMKFFPAEVNGGLAWLKAVAGPLPDLRFVATGGIDASNASPYLAQKNVCAVAGSWLAPSRLIAAEVWPQITRLCQAAAALTAG